MKPALRAEGVTYRRGATALVFRADTKLGGCAVGDLDPRHAGNEIASVALQTNGTQAGTRLLADIQKEQQ